MGHYHFHIRDAAGLVEDEDGVDLPDLTSALRFALRSAREFFEDGATPTTMEFEISDNTGQTVLKVPIRDLTPSRRPVARSRVHLARHSH
jgi:hypothetical protein